MGTFKAKLTQNVARSQCLGDIDQVVTSKHSPGTDAADFDLRYRPKKKTKPYQIWPLSWDTFESKNYSTSIIIQKIQAPCI